MLLGCEDGAIGPAKNTCPKGNPGLKGDKGDMGEKGDSGTDTTARYIDFTLSWDGSKRESVSDYTLPKFDAKSEYIYIYIISEGLLYHPLPYYGAAFNTNGIAKIVDIKYYFASTGKLIVNNLEYRETGASSFRFRAIVAPMVAGAKNRVDLSYTEISEMYDLKPAQ